MHKCEIKRIAQAFILKGIYKNITFRNLIVTFLLFFSVNLNASSLEFKIDQRCVPLKDFSKEQKDVIVYAYFYGLDHSFGYTLAAIAWKESCAGEYLINFSDPSAGIYHAYIPVVIRKYTKYKDSKFLRNIVGQMLVNNPEFASSIALDNLKYWHKVRNGNFKNIIKSYNKGFSWEKSSSKNKIAESYYKDIKLKVDELQEFLPQIIKDYDLNVPYRIPNYSLEEELYKKDGKYHPHSPDAKQPEFFLLEE